MEPEVEPVEGTDNSRKGMKGGVMKRWTVDEMNAENYTVASAR